MKISIKDNVIAAVLSAAATPVFFVLADMTGDTWHWVAAGALLGGTIMQAAWTFYLYQFREEMRMVLQMKRFDRAMKHLFEDYDISTPDQPEIV